MDIDGASHNPEVDKTAPAIHSVEFWGNPLTGIFGWLKKTFGKVYDVFVKGYNKLKGWVMAVVRKLTPKSGSLGEGLVGSALKAVFNILKVVARIVLSQIIDLFKQDMATAIEQKIKAWIENEFEDEIKAVQFDKPEILTRSGYILAVYEDAHKIDLQIYEALSDGRTIIEGLDVTNNLKI